MNVKSLHLYPIKGMSAQNVSSAKLLEKGFENDRRYMLVNEEGTFISQRSHPILTQFYPKIEDGTLSVKYKESQFSISLEGFLSTIITATVFDSSMMVHLVSLEADQWFSDILNQPIRLVKMLPEDSRLKKLIKGPESTEVSFADGYPYLIAGTASLQELNKRLNDDFLMNRFRPNIVVETAVPHIEDTWESIKIGGSKMMVIKPCARCPVVTIDQKTGERAKEPLKTLATYRKKENKVYFGANAIRMKNGSIHIGDEVIVL